MARFNLDFAWVPAITLRAVRSACDRSANVALGTLDPRNERREGNPPNASAEGTTPLGPNVSLHALIAKISRDYFFSLA